jgi:phosphate transport system substrate-binding protein
MPEKNETPTLIGALLITLVFLGGGIWMANRMGLWSGGPWPSSERQPVESMSASSHPSGSEDLAQVANVPAGDFTYGGSTTFAPIRGRVDVALQAARSEFHLQYISPVGQPPSSSAGIKMLLNRQIDFAQSSRPLNEAEQALARSLNVTLKEEPVAIDSIALAVHPSLPLPGLTLDQIRGIYLGQIRNWQSVGGPDLAITPISRGMGTGGTVNFFQEVVLGGQPLGEAVQIAETTTEALQSLGANSGAIYYASAPEVVPQCTVRALPIGRSANHWVAPYREPLIPPSQCPDRRNQINPDAVRSGNYPLTRNLYVIWKQDGSRSQQAGQAYAKLMRTQPAQDLLLKAGFVPLQ